MSTASGPDQVSIRFPSRLEMLGIIEGMIAGLCDRIRFDENTSAQVSLAIIEATTNAIQHGHQRDSAQPVEILFTLFEDRIEVVVQDYGSGFDPGALDGDVTSPENLLNRRGRGIHIMRSFMDSVDFEFSASGTTCRLMKRRPDASAVEGG